MTKNSFDKLLAETEIDDQTLSHLVRLPVWTPRQAHQVLQAQARSGKSIVRFAARHRFSPSRLYTWRKRLEFCASPEAAELPPPFVPISVSVASALQKPESTGPEQKPCRLRVRMPSGAIVHVFCGAPESLVLCVLSSLKEPAC